MHFRMDGVFAVYKPSGVSSSKLVGDIQEIFTKSQVFHNDLQKAKDKMRFDLGTNKNMSKKRIETKVRNLKVKIGHGGTLDPLASGVLVMGVGLGTKKLQHYLTECKKQYRTRALLGISTTTGDSEGEIITMNLIDHILKELVDDTAAKFTGDLKQTPPIFSALKMNGMALYDYARKGIPLPKNIKVREVSVSDVIVHDDSLSTDHGFERLHSELGEDGKPKEHGLSNNPTLNDSPLYFSKQWLEKAEKEGKPLTVGKPRELQGELPEKLPQIHLTCDVSSGTYIRSLISDMGRAMELSAYMVELERTRQSEWIAGKNVFAVEDFEDEKVWGPVLKKCFEEKGELNVSEELSKIKQGMKSEGDSKSEGESKNGEENKEGENKSENKNEEEKKSDETESKGDSKGEENAQSTELITTGSELPQKRSINEVEK